MQIQNLVRRSLVLQVERQLLLLAVYYFIPSPFGCGSDFLFVIDGLFKAWCWCLDSIFLRLWFSSSYVILLTYVTVVL